MDGKSGDDSELKIVFNEANLLQQQAQASKAAPQAKEQEGEQPLKANP